MTARTILGVDPGPQCGLLLLTVEDGRVTHLARGLEVADGLDPVAAITPWRPDVVAVEAFTIGNATMRRSRQGSMAAIGQLEGVKRQCQLEGVPCVVQPLQAKRWATDARLKSWAVGATTLYDYTAGGGGHDRDAARHALYLAVQRRWLPARPNRNNLEES